MPDPTIPSNSAAPFAHCASTPDLDTLHRGWSAAVKEDFFATGNIWSNTQFSNYIRPATDRLCNNFVFDVGVCQNFDLRPYRARVPDQILRHVGHMVDANGGGCLYLLRLVIPHRIRDPEVRYYGEILTDRLHNVLFAWPRPHTKYAESIVECTATWFKNLDHTPMPIRQPLAA